MRIVQRLRGGGPDPQPEMSLAAGGKIEQAIVRDSGDHYWDNSQTRWFNVQIPNSASFSKVTGLAAPPTPIDARAYAEHGYPFFEMWEEPTDVAGDFAKVKSVAQIEKKPDPVVKPRRIVRIANWLRRERNKQKDDGRKPKNGNKAGNDDEGTNNVGIKSTAMSSPSTGDWQSGSPSTTASVDFFEDGEKLPVFWSLEELERMRA